MEEGNLRDLEVVDKVRETDGSGIIIGEILCLFTYIYFPIFLLPLVCWSRLQKYEAGKGLCQGWEGSNILEGGLSQAFCRFRRLRICPTFPDLVFVYKIWKESG